MNWKAVTIVIGILSLGWGAREWASRYFTPNEAHAQLQKQVDQNTKELTLHSLRRLLDEEAYLKQKLKKDPNDERAKRDLRDVEMRIRLFEESLNL